MCASEQIIPRCIRPVIFENADAEWRFSTRGTSFLVTFERAIYVVTAKHVMPDYLPSQYRIQNQLGSHNILPIRQPFTPEFYIGENYEAVDFEDFVVIPIDSAKTIGTDFDPADACMLDESPIQWSGIRRVSVFGFPSQINFVDYDKGMILNQPCAMIGCLTGESYGEGMRQIQFNSSGDLSSFDGFSGSPVFQVADSGRIERLLGMVLRGSLDTSTSRLCYFLDIRAVPALIRHHLQQIATR